MNTTLISAIKSVNWEEIIGESEKQYSTLNIIEERCRRIAVWGKQLEENDTGNPAMAFVRQMQLSMHQFGTLWSLGLYQASAASMRSLF